MKRSRLIGGALALAVLLAVSVSAYRGSDVPTSLPPAALDRIAARNQDAAEAAAAVQRAESAVAAEAADAAVDKAGAGAD